MKATMITLILGCIFTFGVSAPATTAAFVITLDSENAMILAPTNGMVLLPFLDPPDERLGQAVLQLTYEPKGVPQLFNLVSITVATGSLNVGIQYKDGTIAVYNDLTAGVWPLDGDSINRVTLECPSGGSCPSPEALHAMFRVQSLEIEPLPEILADGHYCCPAKGDGSWKDDEATSRERGAKVADGMGCKPIDNTANEKQSCNDGSKLGKPGESIPGAARACKEETYVNNAVQDCTYATVKQQ